MSLRSITLAALALMLAGSAQAQNPAPSDEAEAAAINMRLAATLCLQNIRDPEGLVPAFEGAGFTVMDWIDPDSYEAIAPGVYALIVNRGGREGYCSVQSTLVPLAVARAIGDALVADGGWVPGWPGEDASAPPPLCEGYVNWNARPIITIRYFSAGNAGDCDDDGTSAIVID